MRGKRGRQTTPVLRSGPVTEDGEAGRIARWDQRISRRIIRGALLIMSNLRTKGRENVGWGYTNQPGGAECE